MSSKMSEAYRQYVSFIVLGLADAIVEISGIHAGSLGIYSSTQLTGLAGIVAGAAASIAMASAAYAQAKHGFKGSPATAALFTGISYFVSAILLAAPYFFTSTAFAALGLSLFMGILIIAASTYFHSKLERKAFLPEFLELAAVMLVATVILFFFGAWMKTVFHISTG